MTNIHDDVDISLYHLIFIGNSIERTFKAFANIIGKISENDELVLFVNTSSLIIVQTISFLDEYHNFIRSEETELHTTIVDIKKTVKPAITVINQWKELGHFRNQVLAHNLRDKKENKSVFERGLSSYDIPQHGTDLHVLVSCIGMIKEVFESTFQEKLSNIQRHLDESSPNKTISRYNEQTFEKEIERIRTEINNNIRQLKTEKGVL